MNFGSQASIYGGYADLVSAQYGIPPEIFRSQIGVESGWNSSAIGKAGEIGLTQIMPSTAQQYGLNVNALRTNAEYQLGSGAYILSNLFQKFGNWRDALAGYNAGPGNLKAGYPYADKVLGIAGATDAGKGYNGYGETGGKSPNDFSYLDPRTWPSALGVAFKPYAAQIGVTVLALLLIAVGIWKGIK